MKKILLSMLLVIFVLSCGSKPEKTVSKFIDSIKAQNIKMASKQVLDDSELAKNVAMEYNTEVQKQLFQVLFKNMNYKIVKNEKINKKTSIVTVEVENVDIRGIFMQVFAKMAKNIVTGQHDNLSVEETFKSVLESNNLPLIKKETEFIVHHKGFKNKIELRAENIDILFGGINSTLNNLDTLSSGDENETNNQNSSETKTETTEHQGPTAGNDQSLMKSNKK